jgi:signal transduction histidine kinase
LYETFLDQASIFFLVLDQGGTIEKINEFAQRQIGTNIIGKPFETIILDFYNTFDFSRFKNTPDVQHPLNIKRKNGMPQTYQFRFISSGASIYVLGELDNDEMENVRREILSLNEELNNLTRELHKKNAQLDLLNQEKNRFLGMAAHDLRKPIGLILSYSDFLIDEASDVLNEEHIGFLNTVQKSCIFMKRLVDDFLDVSAIEAGKFDLDLRSIIISDVLEQSLRLNMLQATKKGVDLSVETDQDLPLMTIDPPKIEQVITNLVSNAIEHTLPETPVVIRLGRKEDMICFSVADKGPGIPEDEIHKIFQPFEKTSIKKTGGEKSTGLGMLISRKIIEAHDGKIWIESRLGKGTHVYFTLPLNRRLQ